MTDSAVAVRQDAPQLTPFEVIERVITQGDLAKMSAGDRVAFYWRTCESLGLNPLTRPFEFISLNGKLTMYARKDATDQLRKINAVSVTEVRREKDDDLGLLTVYARGRDKSGREDEATGVVAIKGLAGEALANAVMKAETKAKRRLTLSLVGLGFLDESEIEGRGDVDVDPATGEITERAKPKSLLESVRAQQEALTAADAPGAAETPSRVSASTPSANAAPAAAADDEAVFREAPDDDPLPFAGPAETPAPAAAAPDLGEAIRSKAATGGMKGPMTQPQVARLAEVFGPIGGRAARAGLLALWPEVDVEHLTAAQANAIVMAADSDPEFAAHWTSLAAQEAAGSAA